MFEIDVGKINKLKMRLKNTMLHMKMRQEVVTMQMCPFCDKVYDESEYSHCPYCSGELDDGDEEVRPCPECGGCLHWDGEIWKCSNCDYSEED